MTKAPKRWVRLRALTPEQKSALGAACQTFIATRLKTRFLVTADRTARFYPANITGRWRGHRYTFTKHYACTDPRDEVDGFDQPYARLDHDAQAVDELRFDVMWLRHTGTWWRLRAAIPFEEALDMVETEPVFQVI